VRKLILVLMLSVLLLGFGTAQAATSSLDNIPGGASVFYWQASPGGDYTLLNIQNIADNAIIGTSGAITVHIAFYDYDSTHVFDIECPLTSMDNFGYAITGSGTIVTLTPYSPSSAYVGTINGVTTCSTVQTFPSPANGTDGLQYGYGTVAVNRTDGGVPLSLYRGVDVPLAGLRMPAGDGNGDARNDANNANTTVVLPNMIFTRTALIGPSGAYALNGNMLQGFMNMSRLQAENVPSVAATTPLGAGWEDISIADVACGASTIDWDNSGTFQVGAVALTDFGGIDIHAPELYITDNSIVGGIAMNTCVRGGRYVALGAANGRYWARYNVTPGFTDTTLLTVAPANNTSALNPARAIADTRVLTIPIYDDDEGVISTSLITPPEVGLSPFLSTTNAARPFNSSIAHSTNTAGEAVVTVGAPIYGYAYTVISGTYADLYPLVKERVNINVVNLGIADGASVVDVVQAGY
jgi:hypothetical protein